MNQGMDARLGGATPADDPASLVIREQWDYVEAICRKHLAGMRIEDVHDARQETFLQFINADKDLIREPRAWLTSVARHTCDRIILRRKYRQDELAQREASSPQIPFGGAVGLHRPTRELL